MKNILKAIALILIIASLTLTVTSCKDDVSKADEGASGGSLSNGNGTRNPDDSFVKFPFNGSGIELPAVPLEPLPMD